MVLVDGSVVDRGYVHPFFLCSRIFPRSTLRFLNSLNSGVNVSSVDEKEILLTPLEGAQIFFKIEKRLFSMIK